MVSVPYRTVPEELPAVAAETGAAPSAPAGVFDGAQGLLPGMAGTAPPLPKPRRKTPKATGAPPPFGVEDALQALAEASQGRVVVGAPETWTKNIRARVRGHIQRFPSLAQWRRLGRWLITHETYRGVLGPGWAAGDGLVDYMVKALADKTASGAPPAPAERPQSAPTIKTPSGVNAGAIGTVRAPFGGKS